MMKKYEPEFGVMKQSGVGQYIALSDCKTLESELERLKKDLEQVRASHKRQCDLNDKAWEKVREVEKELAEAKEFILFVAQKENQFFAECSVAEEICKRARAFLERMKDE